MVQRALAVFGICFTVTFALYFTVLVAVFR
jgi:hypothetical protein